MLTLPEYPGQCAPFWMNVLLLSWVFESKTAWTCNARNTEVIQLGILPLPVRDQAGSPLRKPLTP